LNPDLIVAYGYTIIEDPLLSTYEGQFLNLHLGMASGSMLFKMFANSIVLSPVVFAEATGFPPSKTLYISFIISKPFTEHRRE
jgi:hypothetical protein